MKILLIRFSALGDVAMLAPVVKQYAMAYPDVQFTVLSQPFCAPLFDELAPNVKFIGKDIKREYDGVLGIHRLFSELNRMHFDVVCDLHDVLRTKLLRVFFQLHKYKVTILNKHRPLRRRLVAHEKKNKQVTPLPTSFTNYREAIPLPEPMNAKVVKPVTRLDSNLIGIAPFAAHDGKIYPLDRMETLVKTLSKERKWKIILFGGGGEERAIMNSWAIECKNVYMASNLCNNLRDELHLMAKLRVMISMDSANMHLASFAGTRVISVWGATHPFAGFLGWQQDLHDCVQRPLSCRPCSIYGNKPCTRIKETDTCRPCMDIDIKKILNKIHEH